MLAHELAHVKRKPATVVAEASGGRTHRRHREMPPAGFEDRDDHRTACASILLILRCLSGYQRHLYWQVYCHVECLHEDHLSARHDLRGKQQLLRALLRKRKWGEKAC